MRIAIIPPGHKLQLAVAALVIVFALAWGIKGSIPTEVAGDGIMLRSNQQVLPVRGRADGAVARITVSTGDRVVRDQVIAELQQFDIREQRRLAMEKLEDLRHAMEEMEARYQGDMKARQDSVDEKVASLEKAIALARQQRARLQSLVADEEKLLKEGYLTREKLNNTKSSFEDVLARIADLETQISETRSGLVNFLTDQGDRLETAKHEIHEQERVVAEIENRANERRLVRTPVDGFVAEIRVNEGQTVGPDDILMTVAEGDDDVEVLGFLSPVDGRRVEPGMIVHVIPTSVKKEEFGTMRGTVLSVSEQPVSLSRINVLVRDEELAKSFVADGVPYLTRVRLFEDASRPSGYEWSAGSGPPFPIRVGTRVALEVVVREQPPISLVVPALRKALGLY